MKLNDTTAKDFFQSQMHCGSLFDSFNDFCCTSDILGPLMCKLKLNCAAGANNVTAEHLCYSGHSIKFCLSIFFKCLSHGFVPKACLDTLLVPIVKMYKIFIITIVQLSAIIQLQTAQLFQSIGSPRTALMRSDKSSNCFSNRYF